MSDLDELNPGAAVSPVGEEHLGSASETDPQTATFVRHLAHELRQPLSTIESIAYYLDLVLPEEAPKARQQIAKLQELVEQSNWIVSNAVQCVESKTPVTESVPVPDLVARAEALCGEFSPRVQVVNGPDAPPLRVDPCQGEHLFHNLLMLCRHVAPDAPVEVRASRAGEFVRVTTCTRPGQQTVDAHDAAGREFSSVLPPGARLSVASMERIVEAHGGAVQASSDGRDVSVEFTIPS